MLRGWRPGAYLSNSGVLFFWLMLRSAAQAVTVVLLARELGASGYGQFVAGLAIATLLSPLAGAGMQAVILRDGSRKPEHLPELFAASLQLWWYGVLSFGVLSSVTGYLLVDSNSARWAAPALIFSEFAAVSLIELIGRVEQARGRMHRFGALQAGLPSLRLLLLGATMALSPGSLGVEMWMLVYAATGLAYTAAALWGIRQDLGHGEPPMNIAASIREGRPFLVGALAARIQAEFNKPVLAQYSLHSVGNLSAAQRIIDVASLPLIAMQEVLWPRLYADAAPERRALVTGAALVGMALLIGAVLTLAAPLVPYLLGGSFEPAVRTLSLLAWLPALQLVRNIGNVYLAASGYSAALTWVYIGSALTGAVLTMILVAQHGLDGAIYAAYAAELAFILLQTLARAATMRKQ